MASLHYSFIRLGPHAREVLVGPITTRPVRLILEGYGSQSLRMFRHRSILKTADFSRPHQIQVFSIVMFPNLASTSGPRTVDSRGQCPSIRSTEKAVNR